MDAKIFLKAIKLIEKDEEHFACLALDQIAPFSTEGAFFKKLFDPNQLKHDSPVEIYFNSTKGPWFGEWSSEQGKNERITALLFAYEMAKGE